MTLLEHRTDLVRALQWYQLNEETEALRAVAQQQVHARRHILGRDGLPDWVGRTRAYRDWVRSAYDDAGISEADRARIQAAVRYHVSATLREVLAADEVQALGLIAATAAERSGEGRRRREEATRVFSEVGPITSARDAIELLAGVNAALRRVDLRAVLADPDGGDELRTAIATSTQLVAQMPSAVARVQRELAHGRGGSDRLEHVPQESFVNP